ncbi:MAG: efflux RND transporter periplasmic adaptor subunit, partial [Verrucomicrobiota bacterium]
GDYYEVISGLNEGDQVITSANFLIDSESRIQGALKSWSDEKSSLNHSSSAVPLKP